MKKLLVILSLITTTTAFAGGGKLLGENLKTSMQAQAYDLINGSIFSCVQIMGRDRKLTKDVTTSAVRDMVLEILSNKVNDFEYIDSSHEKGYVHFMVTTKVHEFQDTKSVSRSTVYFPLNANSTFTTFNFNYRETDYGIKSGKVQADDYTYRAECTFSK